MNAARHAVPPPRMLWVLLSLAGCIAGARPNPASAGRLRAGAGIDYSSGDYGQNSTSEIIYVPVSLGYETGPLVLNLVVPYLSVAAESGTVSVLEADQDTVVLGPNQAVRDYREAALGDVLGTVTWMLPARANNTLFLDLRAKIKFPTADRERGLGTGRTDFALELDLTRKTGPLSWLGTIGYRILGKTDELDFNNVWYGTLGAGGQINKRIGTGLLVDFRQAALPNREDPLELTSYLACKLGPHWRLTTYAVAGLSEASPDYALGCQIGFRQ